MAFKILVNGADASLQVNAVEYSGEGNERSTLKFSCEPGYEPGLRQEVYYYKQDATTPTFGGVIFTRSLQGISENSDHAIMTCDCADWGYYLDRILIDGGVLTGTVTLKSALQWVLTFLAGHGFTLHASQVDGPSHYVEGFQWERKTAAAIFNDLTVWSGGYVRTVSPLKVIRFVQPNLASPTAPYAINATTKAASRVSWTESSEKYANRVEVKWGGTGTRAKTDAFEIDAGIISDGYYETELPSVPNTGVSATINGSAATIGPVGSGSQLTWDWATHRVTVGTYSPTLGDDLTITYTAQYPGTTIVTGSGSPTLTLPPVVKDDIVDAATALAYANGLLAMHNQDVREFEIDVTDEGLQPGQVLSIDLANRSSVGMTAGITSVAETPGPGTYWRYLVRAISGVHQGSPLDFWRGLGGGSASVSGPPIVTYTGGPNPATGSGIEPLGGATDQAVIPGSGTYLRVINAVPFVASRTCTGVIRVEMWARGSGVSVTARLRDLTTPATAGTSSAVTSQTPTLVSFTAPIVEGRRYELQVTSNTAGAGVYAIGSMLSI